MVEAERVTVDIYIMDENHQLQVLLQLDNQSYINTFVLTKVIEPLLVTIPHCAHRVASREAVIRVISDDGRWTDYPTTEATVEDMKVRVSLCHVLQGTLFANDLVFLDTE